jgi:hypothetical protein
MIAVNIACTCPVVSSVSSPTVTTLPAPPAFGFRSRASTSSAALRDG